MSASWPKGSGDAIWIPSGQTFATVCGTAKLHGRYATACASGRSAVAGASDGTRLPAAPLGTTER